MSQSINPSAPTVVLVHGTFADSSSWNSVTPSLLDQGYPGSCHCDPLDAFRAARSGTSSTWWICRTATSTCMSGRTHSGGNSVRPAPNPNTLIFAGQESRCRMTVNRHRSVLTLVTWVGTT